MADLRQRTGLPTTRVAVGRIDFSRDTAKVVVTYDEPRAEGVEARKGVAPGGSTVRYLSRERNLS
jgi:hypothetical protein